MGSGASSASGASSGTETLLSNLSKHLFVEGAGCERANGKYILHPEGNFRIKSSGKGSRKGVNVAGYHIFPRNVWFTKEDDKDCWIGLAEDAGKPKLNGKAEQSIWIIFTAQEVLYKVPTTDGKIAPPRQGRWELDGTVAAPAPTVNVRPLPAAFLLSGWKGHHDCLNGEYMPLDDGRKLLNGRPIFKHTSAWATTDNYRMFWSQGVWRIGDKNHMETNQAECMAFFENDSTHPSATTEMKWWGTADGDFGNKENGNFILAMGVSITTGMSVRISLSKMDGDGVTSLTVRPWFDTVEDLEALAFATDTPSQRQQLFLDGTQLQDDGRVLAQHGVLAECTIQLVTLEKKEVLDAIFDESGMVWDMDVVGPPIPETKNLMAGYLGGIYCPADGRIYPSLMNGNRAVRFDPATETWETFGDTFPYTSMLTDDKWLTAAISSYDNCVYAFPASLKVVHKMLRIDPINGTAKQVGEDMRPLSDSGLTGPWFWCRAVAGADGCIYGIPGEANCVARFDPRTNKCTTFGELEDIDLHCISGVLPAFPTLPKYFGGTLGPSGRYIFCPPAMARKVLCIDTQDLTVELIGDDLGTCEGGSLCFNYFKYMGGGALAGDNCIYAIPYSSCIQRALRIDPVAKSASFFGPRLRGITVSGYLSGCAGKDGCVYFPPDLTKLGTMQIDPFAGTVRTVGPEPLPPEWGQNNCSSAVLDRDGALWFLMAITPARLVRLGPRRPQTALLALLLQFQHRDVLLEGLRDQRCYGPALVVALWREAVRVGGESKLVCGFLEAAATVLPTAVTASINEDNCMTASLLLRTILTVLPPQENDYYFNPNHNTWEWHEAEAQKRGMHLAHVSSEEENAMLTRITNGREMWLGGCRKSTSRQPPDEAPTGDGLQFRGADDWEWIDGAPWSFLSWSDGLPMNGSGVSNRIFMSKSKWSDGPSSKLMPGIYRRDRCSPPLDAIRAIVTDRDVLPQCFAASEDLRDLIVRILYRVLSLKVCGWAATQQPTSKVVGPPSHPPVNEDSADRSSLISAIVRHVEADWPDLATAFRAVRRAPPEFSVNDRDRFAFLSHFVAALAILDDSVPNAWQALPKTADDWCWPPAPLVPLRSACKLVQKAGPDTVRAVWPILAGLIAEVLVRIVDAVRADPVAAANVLTKVFDRERKMSLETYQKQLRRARRDPTFPEFKATAAEFSKQLATLDRKKSRTQATASFPELYSTASAMHTRYDDFLAKLAHKCAAAEALHAPLKGIGRALEKLVLAPGVVAKFKTEGLESVRATTLVDVLRGSLKCSNFTNIVFVLELLELLDVDMGNPKKAVQQGWDLEKYQIRIIHIKDRFTSPTSGGWADAMVNFTFVHGDDTQHVMELQIQHEQMLVVRKEGKAHNQYNSFRSAFELLEAVGREPHDGFDDTDEDLAPLEKLARTQQQLVSGMQQMVSGMQELRVSMQQQMDALMVRVEQLEKTANT